LTVDSKRRYQKRQPARPRGGLTLVLVPLGEVEPRALAALAAGLRRQLQGEALVGPTLPLPRSAYHARRQQYLASDLLSLLRGVIPGGASVVLGVTEADLYAPRLNFVFGQAELGGKAGVVSLARLRPTWYGEPPDPARLDERALKEAMHELGHLLGAEHCPHPECVMYFSHGLADTDRKGYRPCPRCQAYYPLREPALP